MVKQLTRHSPKCFNELKRLEELDKLEKVERWKNLTFTRDGKSHLGLLVHSTKEAALAAHIAAKTKSTHINCGCVDCPNIFGQPCYAVVDITFNTQIPWMKD